MFTRRSWLAAATLLTVLVVCPSHLPADSPGSLRGLAFGAWDLPASQQEPGWCYGVLYESNTYQPLFLFVAELQERPSPTTFRTGPIYGVLYSYSQPGPRPLFYVEGSWRGPRNATEGSWAATIYSLDTFLPVGEMRGPYQDPAPFEVGRWGEFSGQWQIAR